MHITVTREDLLPALALAAKAVDQKCRIPILGCAMLSVECGWLDIITTDMDVSVKASVRLAESGTEGVMVLPIKPLHTFVRSLAKGSVVTISTSEVDGVQSAEVSAKDRSISLTLSKIEDYPIIASVKPDAAFKMAAAEFHRLLRQVKPAISTEETRYYLNGIYLLPETKEDGSHCLRAVATDGHRLMLSDTALPAGFSVSAFKDAGHDQSGIIIPRLTVGLILDLLGKNPTGDIEFRFSGMRISVRHGSRLVLSKLVDGVFPEYQRVIPRGNENILTTNAADCADVTKSVADSVSKELSRPVKFSLTPERVEVSARNEDGGQAQSKLNGITRYVGEPLEIGFQARYVRDLLSVVDGTVHFALGTEGGPAVLTSDAFPNWLSVLMPIRV